MLPPEDFETERLLNAILPLKDDQFPQKSILKKVKIPRELRDSKYFFHFLSLGTIAVENVHHTLTPL